MHFSNAYSVALASRDVSYRSALNLSGLTFPDGKPIAWAMRSRLFGGTKTAGQIRDPSFFTRAIDQGRAQHIRHFFFGSSPSTLVAMAHAFEHEFPGVQIAGTYSPAISADPQVLASQLPASVDRTTVDVVWVALGTPKQDFVANEIAARTGLVVLAVGAAFDFASGSVQEAPAALQRAGLEWAYRFSKEPRRMWRRYLLGNLLFLRALLLNRLGRSGSKS